MTIGTKECSVTIDVTPFVYTKSDKSVIKKESITYDNYTTKQ